MRSYTPVHKVKCRLNILLRRILVDTPVVLAACAESLILLTVSADVNRKHTEGFILHAVCAQIRVRPCTILIKNGLSQSEVCCCILTGLAR